TRTVGVSPNEQGWLGGDTGPDDITVFDDTTRPTAEEVEALITTSAGAVEGMILEPVDALPDKWGGLVTHAIALYTAILIEVSFFRETANQDLITLWRDWLNQAVAAVNE